VELTLFQLPLLLLRHNLRIHQLALVERNSIKMTVKSIRLAGLWTNHDHIFKFLTMVRENRLFYGNYSINYRKQTSFPIIFEVFRGWSKVVH